MRQKTVFIYLLLLIFGYPQLNAQLNESPIKIFGYFQNEFEYRKDTGQKDNYANSFALQQLNLFFQKDLGKNWTSLVNFEIINSFSSLHRQGAFKLDEAWVRYRASKQFKLKLGLQIPKFNNLNEIKNRTPLLPYVIRPLVYETSLSEDIAVEEYTPSRAYVQIYGFIPSHNWKIDHAIYIGNTPNINSFTDSGRSGLDTTNAVLLGCRFGVRYKEFKFGLSATSDIVNYSWEGFDTLLNVSKLKFNNVKRIRLGSDLSYNYNNFSFEAEYISVNYDYDIPGFSFDKKFYYATVGYYINDPLFFFISYWLTEEDYPPYTVYNKNVNTETLYVNVPNIGLTYNFNDRIILKAHYAHIRIKSSVKKIYTDRNYNFFACAVSVFF